MKFEEIIPTLKEGKKIRRKCWQSQEYIEMSAYAFWGKIVDEEDINYSLTIADLTEDDWEIMEDE